MQETKKESENNSVSDTEKPESIMNSGRHSSERNSFLKSISRESSGIGNSSRHSFTGSYGVPPIIGPLETASDGLEVPLYRLAYLNKPEIPVLLLGTLAAVANGVIMPIFGLMLSEMVKTFYEPADKLRKDSKFWALIFVALGVASFLIFPGRFYFFAVAGGKLIKRVRKMCFEKAIHMEISWFDEAEHSSGAIGARLSTDAASVKALVGDALGLQVQNIATAIAGLVIAFEASWQLALIMLVMLPLILLNGYAQFKFVQGFSADAKVSSSNISSLEQVE